MYVQARLVVPEPLVWIWEEKDIKNSPLIFLGVNQKNLIFSQGCHFVLLAPDPTNTNYATGVYCSQLNLSVESKEI